MKNKKDEEKHGMIINRITNCEILVKSIITLSICILLILAIPDIENGIYCETDKKIPPDLTLIYSSDIKGYYRACG